MDSLKQRKRFRLANTILNKLGVNLRTVEKPSDVDAAIDGVKSRLAKLESENDRATAAPQVVTMGGVPVMVKPLPYMANAEWIKLHNARMRELADYEKKLMAESEGLTASEQSLQIMSLDEFMGPQRIELATAYLDVEIPELSTVEEIEQALGVARSQAFPLLGKAIQASEALMSQLEKSSPA